jgi:N6-L-threonylcarbamoyladenine synthase
MNNHLDIVILGETKDDAIGELFDKSAVLMGYNYPGGPVLEMLAKKGKNTYKLPFPKDDKSLDFSFSGLKSEISRLINKESKKLNVNDLACSLQNISAEILAKKLKNAWLVQPVRSIVIGGGVIANQFLRNYLEKKIKQ